MENEMSDVFLFLCILGHFPDWHSWSGSLGIVIDEFGLRFSPNFFASVHWYSIFQMKRSSVVVQQARDADTRAEKAQSGSSKVTNGKALSVLGSSLLRSFYLSSVS